MKNRNMMNRTEQTGLNLSMVLVRIPYTWQIPYCLSSSGWWPCKRHEITWLWEEMQCFHCSGPEAIKLSHAVPFAKAHCCCFTANMISSLTAVNQ